MLCGKDIHKALDLKDHSELYSEWKHRIRKYNIWLLWVWTLEFLLFFSHAGSKFISKPDTTLFYFYFFEMMYYPDLLDYSEKYAFYIAA